MPDWLDIFLACRLLVWGGLWNSCGWFGAVRGLTCEFGGFLRDWSGRQWVSWEIPGEKAKAIFSRFVLRTSLPPSAERWPLRGGFFYGTPEGRALRQCESRV